MISQTYRVLVFPKKLRGARCVSFLAGVTTSFFAMGAPTLPPVLAATLGNARALLRY